MVGGVASLMLNLGALAFVDPWLLLALLGLPLLWWLLRITPPAPKHIAFPPLRLLLDLKTSEQTPAHTPLWLLLLRLFLAGLAILALAHPIANPGARLAGNGPVLLVVDDGWAAASHWQERARTLTALLDQAE
ncbi:MAG TPA: BatA domain-containing protein, partial [Candidatus Cybelea sp.]|nr:BatA domain-containing protein [Candidatus Cybelea sp.]